MSILEVLLLLIARVKHLFRSKGKDILSIEQKSSPENLQLNALRDNGCHKKHLHLGSDNNSFVQLKFREEWITLVHLCHGVFRRYLRG